MEQGDKTLNSLPRERINRRVHPFNRTEVEPETQVEHCFDIETLPSVVVSHVITFLEWNDKYMTALALPSWEESLLSTRVWVKVTYRELTFQAQPKRKLLSQCIIKYGKYFTNFSLSFRYALGRSGTAILKDIANCCVLLKKFEVVSTLWDSQSGIFFCDILRRCPKLDDVAIVRPSLVWGAGDQGKDSVLVPLVKEGHASKVTKLVLCGESLVDHEGSLDLLAHFINLKSLKIRRQELTEQLLLLLVSHQLQEVSLFQEEDLPLNEPMLYSNSLWECIRQHKPGFLVNLVLRNIVLLRSNFPSFAPIRAIVLVDLSASLTKGIMDTIINNYHLTLEIFVYTKSYVIGCADLEDRRLPVALTELVHKCSKLHTLVYGFEISSTTTLLLAHHRQLSHFAIPMEELSFEFDWTPQPGWSTDFTSWLVQNGRCMEALEKEVSRLLGYNWRVATEHLMFQSVNMFTNI